MKEIPLSKGYVALVDDDDYVWLSQHRWSAIEGKCTVYASRLERNSGRYVQVSMHRAILDAPPGMVVDHRDGNGLNNTRKNLRLVTQSYNRANSRKTASKTTSRYKGVSQDKRGRWRATIRVGGKAQLLGLFLTEADAARAYDAAAREEWGAFARFNFPRDGEQSALGSITNDENVAATERVGEIFPAVSLAVDVQSSGSDTGLDYDNGWTAVPYDAFDLLQDGTLTPAEFACLVVALRSLLSSGTNSWPLAASFVAAGARVSKPTAIAALDKLCRLDILREMGLQGKTKVYELVQAPQLEEAA